ncbi:hypothetical protein FQZ97_303380 [compost metagenome]
MRGLINGDSNMTFWTEYRSDKTRFALIIAVVTLAWSLICWRWLVGGAVIPFDAMDEFYPQMLFNVRAYLAGELPLWNPYLFSGFANIGDPQGMAFSPLMNLIMMALAPEYLRGFNIAVLVHVLLGGIGVVLCGRDRATPAVIAVIAALVYMFGGVAISRLQHTPMIVGYAFLPYCYLYLGRILRTGAIGAGVLAGVFGGLMLLHGTQVTYLAGLFLVGYTIAHLPQLRAPGRLLALGVAVVVALVLAFPFLYSVKVALAISNRPEISYDYLMAHPGGAAARTFLTYLLAGFSGSNNGRPWLGELTSNYFYIGLLPLLAVVGVLWQRPESHAARHEKRVIVVMLVFFLLYALGPEGHVYRLFYEFVPGVKLFRRPNDAMFLVNALLAFLLLCGDEQWLKTMRELLARRQRVLAWSGLCLAALVLVAGWMIYGGEYPYSKVVLRFAIAVGAYLIAWLLFRHNRFLPFVLIGVVATDIGMSGAAKTFNAVRSSYVALVYPSPGLNKVTQWLRPRLADGDGFSYRIEQIDAFRMWRNVPSAERLYASLGYNPMVLAAYKNFYGAPESASQPRLPGQADAYGSLRFRLLGVKYVVTSGSLEHQDANYLAALRGPVAEFEETKVWEVRHPLPRVLNPKRFELVAPGAAAAGFSPESMVEITDNGEMTDRQRAELQGCTGNLSYTLLDYQNNQVRVEYLADRPAWFVLSDTYHPWWKASINGNPVPLYQANQAFRAVCVPAGKGVLSMDFRFMGY